ncbi:MAG TPA: cadmium-translocating P-type ATPase [Firmicutes bacterium]|nr:cadmium-translocating P-type ATPase [Bacillota bacterium]
MQYEVCGLNCPSCAEKIEKQLKQNIDPEASVNITTRTITLTKGSVEEATKIIQKIEPNATIAPKTNMQAKTHNHEHSQSNLKILLLSILLFGLGFIYKPFFLLGYILSGYPVLLSAFQGIIRKDFLDEKFLMSIATIGAVAVGEWAEAAAVMILYSLGEHLEELASENTRTAVTSLIELTPESVRVLSNGESILKDPSEVEIGDLILVRAGERIPLDGIIVNGSSTLDTSALTGESLPKEVTVDETVQSGVINLSSPLTIQVKAKYENSTVARMLKLIEEASEKKASSERFITRFARYYTPFVVLGALLIALLPPLFGAGSFSEWGYRALVLLVVSCPCALVISVPLAYFSGIGRASQLGILVKGGEVFDKISHIDTTVWDKTGTLTSGEFEVVNIKCYSDLSENDLLQIAFSLEEHSNHPLAQAIVKKANELNLKPLDIEELKEIAGYGLEGVIDNKTFYVGSVKYMESLGFTIEEEHSHAFVAVATDNELLGAFELLDKLKPSSTKAISKLKDRGLKTVVLTGDRSMAAKKALQELPLDDLQAELLPEDKLAYVNRLVETGKTPLFVGDGINDAPVLASSFVGVAMGGIGSDAAIEASDVVLVTDEPVKVPLLFNLADAVRQKVITNITLTLAVKFTVIGLSIFGLASMWQAVIADVGVTIVAILNAASLFRQVNN